MHIAWLGKKTPFCGNVTYSREVTNALLDRGHQVSFFHFATEVESGSEVELNETEDPALLREDVSLPYLYKSQIYTIPNPRASKVLTEALKTLAPDLVHASLTLSPLDFALPELCAELGLPLVATFHPAFDRRRRNIASRTQYLAYQIYAPALAHYHRVIVFSEAQQQILIKLGVGSQQVITIPNGVDVDKFSPGPSEVKQEFDADHLFVYQGRVAAEKNLEALLKAWKEAEMGDRSKLVIMGDGPLTASLKPFYTAQHGILWLGYIADEVRRIDILRGADVFVLPSLVEGLSLSLLEAMACGVAPVATDVGADGEVLDQGVGIRLDPHRITAQLVTLLPLLRDQPEFRQMLGHKARQRVLERYTLSRNITAVEDCYRQLVGSPTQRV
ncbi:MAG: glycosyltransferase family 4 protein [Synechococcaceae cyanobacterium SM2_3_2]|nr:glycosyltransferase family 4 protein [Synechococcaceae cyanobacterium SM2_3_2]